MTEPENLGYVLRVDQIGGVDNGWHAKSLTMLTADRRHRTVDIVRQVVEVVPAVRQHPGTRPETLWRF